MCKVLFFYVQKSVSVSLMTSMKVAEPLDSHSVIGGDVERTRHVNVRRLAEVWLLDGPLG